MKVFSELLLGLYRLAQEVPTEEFQTRAMDRGRAALHFDSAFWATGVVKPGEAVTPHSVHLYHQPHEMLENWMRINANDELAFEAFRKQGVTLNAALCGADWQARFNHEVRAHIQRYGMAHSLNTIIAEPVLQLWMGVAFYRADPNHPFTEAERQLKQNLMPHFAETWNISRFAFLNFTHSSETKTRCGRAICDAQGILYNADRHFAGLMLEEWPGWKGPQLPPVLTATLGNHDTCRHIGQRVVFSVEKLNNMQVVTAKIMSAVNQLSQRELDVATRFADGANYHTIANSLHISPTTVRNHLQHIYIKLGVNNKMEMSRLVRDH